MKSHLLSQLRLNYLALWSVFLLLLIPFSLNYRFNPYLEFYQDILVILLSAVACLCTLVANKTKVAIPYVSIFLFCFSLYFIFQLFVLNIPYWNINIRIAIFFLLLAGLAWSVQYLIEYFQKEKLIVWVAFAVVVGAVFHSVVVFLQATQANILSPFIFYHPSGITGQMGQRNQLGHYLMWGVISLTFLLMQKQIKPILALPLLVFIVCALGLVGSRTIVLYLFVLIVISVAAKLIGKRKPTVHINWLIFSAILVFIAQWGMPLLADVVGINIQSGLGRLSETSGFTDYSSQSRLWEWRKAWHTFLAHPIFGVGYSGYTYYSLILDSEIVSWTSFHANTHFQHSHNIVLQLLAEMGVVGCFLVFGGLVWVLFPTIKQAYKKENIFILSLLAISLCHSLLEFPLWHSNFLTGFVIFLSLADRSKQKSYFRSYRATIQKGAVGIVCVVLSGAIFILVLNQKLISQELSRNEVSNMVDARYYATIRLSELVPLFSEHKDNVTAYKRYSGVDSYDFELVKKYTRYNPIPGIASIYGLILYEQNEVNKSKAWFKKVWHYYPRMVLYSLQEIYDNSPTFEQLEKPVYEACERYRLSNLYPDIFNSECPMPPANKE